MLFCSGKIYYDLLAAREERKADHVAIVRVEQLYPFPEQERGGRSFRRYPQAAEVVWVQEEPRNMGPWRFVRERIQPLLAAERQGHSLRRPPRERQPRHRLAQAPPAGAGRGDRSRLHAPRHPQSQRGPSAG